MGYPLNLDTPQTFSEKMQWLKLYDRHPEYTKMVDKVNAKQWLAERIGGKYIIPTLGIWERAEDIDFNRLPEQFVIKCNHNSGKGMFICRDKKSINVERVRSGLAKGLKQNYYLQSREWPYKNVNRQIIVEQYLSADDGDLKDYKFFCFGGVPKMCQVIKGRETNMVIDFFDMDWRHQPFHEPREYPFSDEPIAQPTRFNEMKQLASILSKGYPFLRVDFYEVDGRVYVGELTFYPTSGMGGFEPNEWDLRFGEWISLPKIEDRKLQRYLAR